MQTAVSKIWALITNYIYCDNSHDTKHVYQMQIYGPSLVSLFSGISTFMG